MNLLHLIWIIPVIVMLILIVAWSKLMSLFDPRDRNDGEE